MVVIDNLWVEVEEKRIIQSVSLNFEAWKNYCILWKNGSWKSSLALTVMGHPEYEVVQWSITVDWEDTTYDLKESFVSFKKIIIPFMEELWIDKEFLWRDLNVGFSGWERRKVEILQLKLLQPKYIFLDEVDSWLDVDAFKAVAWLLKEINSEENSFIIITHYFTILDYIPVDEVVVMKEWSIVAQWWHELAERVKSWWFAEL